MPQYVYLTINKINNKKYLGSHIGKINDNYYGSGTVFVKAFKKYGANNFIKKVLEIVPDNINLLQREQFWLDKLRCAESNEYYNVSPVAGGGNLIKLLSTYKQKSIRKKQQLSRNKSINQSVRKMLKTRSEWSDSKRQEMHYKCSEAAKARYKNLSNIQKKKRIQKIITTKANKSAEEKRVTSLKHSNAIKKWYATLTANELIILHQKRAAGNRGKLKGSTTKQKIANSVSQYYNSLSIAQKEERAKKIGKTISQTKWCNDGNKNYRATQETINNKKLVLGRIKYDNLHG